MSTPPLEPGHTPSTRHVVSRIGAALLAGYGFTWGFATLVTVLGTAAGLGYGDAQTLAYLLAFLVFLVCFLWAFVARSLAKVWLVLVGGAVAMTAVGWLASNAMT